MTSTKIKKSDCPGCGPNRSCDVLYEKNIHEDDGQVWADTTHFVLQCRGCEAVFHQTDFVFSENMQPTYDSQGNEDGWDYDVSVSRWPAPAKRKKPDWFDQIGNVDFELYQLMKEGYAAFDHDLPVLAAIGLRTIFDRATESVGIHPAHTFEEKLSGLQDRGLISAGEKAALSILVDASSAAAHRGWRPNLNQLWTMADIVESFLHRTFVLGEASKKLAGKVPPKAPRIKKAKIRKSQPPT